jgi:hypothetical protein
VVQVRGYSLAIVEASRAKNSYKINAGLVGCPREDLVIVCIGCLTDFQEFGAISPYQKITSAGVIVVS